LANLDLTILHAINSLCGVNWFLDHAVWVFVSDDLIKIVPYVAIFWAIWFKTQNQEKNRETLILMIIAVGIALIANRTLSEILPFRSRPIFVPGLVHQSLIEYPIGEHLNNFSSFPSDHAALVFALAASFWFVSRPLGIFLSAWAMFVLLSRVYFGLHYPSDIIVGSLIGIGAAVLANKSSHLRSFAALVITAERRVPGYFYAVLFVVTYEVADLFEGVRQLANGGAHVLQHLGDIII
jgi:membrane-associated phospholipid phosphatase